MSDLTTHSSAPLSLVAQEHVLRKSPRPLEGSLSPGSGSGGARGGNSRAFSEALEVGEWSLELGTRAISVRFLFLRTLFFEYQLLMILKLNYRRHPPLPPI